jgi:hypothetical protein
VNRHPYNHANARELADDAREMGAAVDQLSPEALEARAKPVAPPSLARLVPLGVKFRGAAACLRCSGKGYRGHDRVRCGGCGGTGARR